MQPRMSKKDLLLALLTEGNAFIKLDGRVGGVALPDWLREDAGVVLQLGYALPIPIPDLKIDDDGVTATLSFRRVPFACSIPWRAVYAVADGTGRGTLFPDDVPPDVNFGVEPPEGARAPATKTEAAAETPSTKPGKRPRPPWLKVVK